MDVNHSYKVRKDPSMTFREQYENTLTVRTDAPSENIPAASYFAGVFYEQQKDCTEKIPAVLCGGSVKISEALTLSCTPLNCRMLLYTQEGGGELLLDGEHHPLHPGTLLYLDRRELSFSLHADQQPWRFITFSFGGGAFSRLRESGFLRRIPACAARPTFFRASEPKAASLRRNRCLFARQAAGCRPYNRYSGRAFRRDARLA